MGSSCNILMVMVVSNGSGGSSFVIVMAMVHDVMVVVLVIPR